MMEEVMERTAVLQPASRGNSRKPKIPVALRFIQWAFPKVESIAPRYAHAWFVKLFFSPPRYPIPASEKAVIQKADRFTVRAGEKHVECYAWGDGPVILLVHGWAGRAGQFRNFILPFVKAGYKVVTFDAPAHGLSKGSATSIIDFKDAILSIEKDAGLIEAVIGHSLGGAAGLFAISEGLNVRKMITIATPTVGDEIIQEFTSRLNGSQRAIDHLKKQIYHTFNRSFDEFMATHFIRLLPVEIDLLVLHDENDKEATLKNAAALLAAYPAAKFIKTMGLGHVRILRDDKVIESCLTFVEEASSKH
jgi:esterase/lipase